jgi:quinol monooxygenase YgiN
MRFARNVHFEIKSGKEQEFTGLFEKEVVPMLRKQNGFVEEMTLVNPKGAYAISLWDDRKSADAYQTSTYPQISRQAHERHPGNPDDRDLRERFFVRPRLTTNGTGKIARSTEAPIGASFFWAAPGGLLGSYGKGVVLGEPPFCTCPVRLFLEPSR